MPRKGVKNLASVLTTSMLMTEDSQEAILVSAKELDQVIYIQYSIAFLGSITQDGLVLDPVSELLNSSNEVNAIHPAFAERLGFVIQTTNISTQKIDGTTFETYGMVVAAFLMTDQISRIRFFEETFLVANVSLDVVFRILFFTMSDADVNFPKRELRWRSYIIQKALFTTKRVKLVGKKEFAAATLDPRHETFVVHVASLEYPSSTQDDNIYPSCEAQIAVLVTNKASTSISTKYSNFTDIFFSELASELLEHTMINDHAIKLVDDWQPFYGPIYNLEPIEFETLKTYIKTNLANDFIRPSKSPARAPIFFDKKPDGSFQLCVHYQGFNNPIIKNWYLLLLVGKCLNQLG